MAGWQWQKQLRKLPESIPELRGDMRNAVGASLNFSQRVPGEVWRRPTRSLKDIHREYSRPSRRSWRT